MSVRRFASNAGWSLGGQFIPMLVAVVAVPILLHKIGVERFGFLSIAWTLMAYAALFDLGVRRAVTRTVAERLGAGDEPSAHASARAALFVAGASGLVLCAVLEGGAGILTNRWLGLSPALQDEAKNAVRLLALSLPLILLTNVYGGILAGYQNFKRLSLVSMAMGIFNYLMPLIVTLFSVRLEALMVGLLLSRLLTNQLHRQAFLVITRITRNWHLPDRANLTPLFRLGGWMSVSNMIGPFLGSMDRVVLAGKVPLASLAHYTTPADMTSRLQMLPNAVLSMLIPAMAGMQNDRRRLAVAYYTSARFSTALILPIVVLVVLFADPLITLWLGADFAHNSYRVMQWFAVGVFMYTIAQPGSVLLIGVGNPKWIAITQLVELPLVFGLLYLLIGQFGIVGAAMTWAFRNAMDAAVFTWCAHKWILHDRPPLRKFLVAGTFSVCLVTSAALLTDNFWRACFLAAVLPLVGAFAWWYLLARSDREKLTSVLDRKFRLMRSAGKA